MSPFAASRAILAGAAVVLLAGCATRQPPMYMWERFPRQQYDALLRSDAIIEEQIRDLEAHAEKAKASAAKLPPGFRAHLGMLYLSNGNTGQARAMWVAEKDVFPESTPYMDQLLKRLDAPVSEKSPAAQQ